MTTPLICPARPGDAIDIVALVRELADYEHALDQVAISVDDLERALFTPNPHVHCLVAEHDGAIVAMALWFLHFSTWTGTSGLYLEDLYVQDRHRGRGIGTQLMRALAVMCVEEGYSRFEWSVLDWNRPAIEFYQSIGAIALDEWTRYRLSGVALRNYARAIDVTPPSLQ